jgi:hypothetical protein
LLVLKVVAAVAEADGSFKDAADGYEQAKDYENLVRISLNHLRDPDRAVNAVKISGFVPLFAGEKYVTHGVLGLVGL